MRVHWFLVAAAMTLVPGCKKEEAEVPKGGPAPAGVKLGPPVKILGTPIAIRVPKGWAPERLEGSDKAEPETPPPGLIDLGETLEMWKASTPSPSGRVDAFVLISMDKRLPKGTTLAQYMDALRKEQTKTVGAKIRHLEAERIERDGRQGFALRDSMDVPTQATGGSAPLHQVARVFLNGTEGITITAMMLEDDKPQLDAQVRAIMESIQFTTPPPKAPDAPKP